MPPWLVKAAVQGVIAQLPQPQRLNRLFQRYVTGSLGLSAALFQNKWEKCGRHLEHHAELTGAPGGPELTVLELGTGWYPVVPIGLSLLGATRVYTVDLQSLLTPERVLDVMDRYRQLIDTGAIAPRSELAVGRLRSALDDGAAAGVDGLLSRVGVTRLVTDARAIGAPAASVHLFVSNNTFEHIPADVLGGILREFRRLAAPGAVGSHYIDMGDHYCTFDPSINVYNYLRFPSWMWRLFNSELQYQNRLRLPDFRRIHEAAGWIIAREEHKLGALEELRKVRVSREFAGYTEQDLRIHAGWMLSRAS